jgi:hypothetical protein
VVLLELQVQKSGLIRTKRIIRLFGNIRLFWI